MLSRRFKESVINFILGYLGVLLGIALAGLTLTGLHGLMFALSPFSYTYVNFILALLGFTPTRRPYLKIVPSLIASYAIYLYLIALLLSALSEI